MKECEICRGARIVRLPIYRTLEAARIDQVGSISPSYREYPCPECAKQAPIDKVAVIEHFAVVDSRYPETPELLEHMRRSAVNELAHSIARSGAIRFEREKPDARELRWRLRASVGVVAYKVMATLEERERIASEAYAATVIAEACAQIDNWGSHFGHSEILKRDAKQMANDALRIVRGRKALEKI